MAGREGAASAGVPKIGLHDLSSLIIVRIARDVILLPVAKGDFQHAHGLFADATQPVFFVGRNPDFIAGLTSAFLLADLHHHAASITIHIFADPESDCRLKLSLDSTLKI